MKNFMKITTCLLIALALGATVMSCKKDVEMVEVTPSKLTLKVGKTSQLSATVTPEKAEYTLSWSSSTPAVAAVDGNGKVTAIAKGTALIRVEAGGKTATCTVIVEEDVPPPAATATVTLSCGDVWGDNTGYQLLLDADHSAFGDIIPTVGPLSASGNVSSVIYNQFEYKIPENADGNLSTSNICLNASISIEVPEGEYDYCITNPTPGDRMWIAGGDLGRGDNFTFEAGKTYLFTVERTGDNDQVSLTIDGVPAKKAVRSQNFGAVRIKK
jgi:gingipain R/gingipain K